MATIDWNDGRLVTLEPGDAATAAGALAARRLYALVFFNEAGHAADTAVDVVWHAGQPPAQVVVPGTMACAGLAAVLLVSGNDTSTVTASVRAGQRGARVEAFVAGGRLPLDGLGLLERPLPADGEPRPFTRFTRYRAVVASQWYGARLESDIDQFFAVQLAEQRATVLVVNQRHDPRAYVQGVGQAAEQYTVQAAQTQALAWNLQGNGSQLAWINAARPQRSQQAALSLQSLAGLFETHRAAAREPM